VGLLHLAKGGFACRLIPCWILMARIFVDADGCPVKDEIYRVAERYKLKVVLVANKHIKYPASSLIEMQVVGSGFDAADDWIVDNVKLHDLVITNDILLADRCLKQQAKVLGSKGEEFTEDNIGSMITMRELNQNLRHMGENRGGPAPMDKKARSQFLAKLDQIIQSIKKNGGLLGV
jgi:uncharacterized protein YaiI (UPF0178 family)